MAWRAWAAALAVFCGAITAAPGLAQDPGERPLLIEGKKALYLRVLARPGATIAAEPGVDDGKPVTPFTVYYVYGRKNMFGTDWIEVGTASRRPAGGWIAGDQLIDWKQTVAVSFTPPSGRQRTLLFRERDKLLELLESETIVPDTQKLRQQALAGPVAADFPVISIEPAMHVDIQQQFYLLPILSWEEAYLDSGFTARLLEVASVTRQEKTAAQQDTLDNREVYQRVSEGLGERDKAIRDYRVGLTFVIDTTTSMGPYIDRTREAVRAVYDALAAEDLTAKISFGLIGFRDNVDAAPGLEYVAKTFADLFMEKVEGVTAAEISSKGFIEDAFAGVVNAAEQLDWSTFGGRYMVLITDAGARRADDPLSRTGMDAAEVRRLAADRQIGIITLHLLTEEGQGDHARAAEQYRVLSRPDTGREMYFAVETGSVEGFAGKLESMTRALTDQIKNAVQGKLIDNPDAPPPPPPPAPTAEAPAPAPTPAPPTGGEPDPVKAAVDAAGHAMQLAYLGRKEGAEAPTLFRAWVADRDLENPDTAALQVRVLMSKNQLSDLQQALKTILEAGRLGTVAPEDFFAQLKSAAAAMSRDPNQVGGQAGGQDEAGQTIGELGLIDEYIADLPYRSKVLNIDEDLWLSWSVGEQEAFVNEIDSKIKLYATYHDDTDRWVALDGGRIPGDAVYPVPLDALL